MIPAVDPLTVAAFAPGALCGALVVVAAIVAWRHDPGRPTTPAWTAAELAAIPRPVGQHRAPGHAPDHPWHVALHVFEEVPPSMWYAAWRLSVVERSKALTAELANWRWRPSRPYRTGVAW